MNDQVARADSGPGAGRADASTPRVLLITRNLPPLTGGMERLLANAVRELSQLTAVAVVGPTGCSQHLPRTVCHRETLGSGIVAFLTSALPQALCAARTFRPGIVVAGSGLTAPIAWLAARLCSCPCAVLIHGLDIVVANRTYQSIFLPCIRVADAVIANSENTARLARGHGVAPGKITVIHPGVEFPAPHHHGFRASQDLAPGTPLLLSVGRIVPRKGLSRFVERCLPALCREMPDLRLAIVGEEPHAALHGGVSELAAIRDAAARHGLQQHVLLCGALPDEMLHAAYAEADALVFPVVDVPGDVEGFGMVAVEAAAHGLPTFGFAAGGVPDAVQDGVTGELSPPENYDDLRARLARYLERRERDHYRSGCLAHAQQHGWEGYAGRLTSVFAGVLERHARQRSRERRDYQYGYSTLHPEVNDPVSRERKATTALAVLREQLGSDLRGLHVLDVGGSGGIMAARFAREGAKVCVIDIDEAAIRSAQQRYALENLEFRVGDAMQLEFANASMDVVLCCHVYEHVPDAARMMAEIRRVLRPGGVCYFAAGNRFAVMEPHYRLPLLSVIPPALAHHYLRLLRRGDHYHERHLSHRQLHCLVDEFDVSDHTESIVRDPERYAAGYMIRPGSLTQKLATGLIALAPQLFPGYIWTLRRPVDIPASKAGASPNG